MFIYYKGDNPQNQICWKLRRHTGGTIIPKTNKKVMITHEWEPGKDDNEEEYL